MKRATVVALVSVGLLLFSAHLVADAQEKSLSLQLIGTWKIVSGKYGGREGGPGEGTTLKHITPAHFMVVSYNTKTGEVTRAFGGTHVVDGAHYKETPRYGFGSDFQAVRDQEHTFECKVEADRLYQTGKLASGLTIEEVWERIKPEQKAR
jgi:hypothetical protein